MGSTYYLDPAAAGSNNGTSWTHAWTNPQSAFDTAVAGDLVYCRGTYTFADATTIDVDKNSGDHTSGYIKFIGCNALGNVDGTRFIMDVNSKVCDGLTWASKSMLWFENIEIKNAGTVKAGILSVTPAGTGNVFINCSINNNASYGIQGQYLQFNVFIRSVIHSNGGDGIYRSTFSAASGCCFRDNAGSGWREPTGCVLNNCIAHGNTDDGLETVLPTAKIFNVVVDGNTNDGILLGTSTDLYAPVIIGCRITNHIGSGDIGLNCNNEPCITGWCYFEDNDGANIQNATLHNAIPLEGGSTSSNLEDLANTDEGYVDKAGHNFATRYVDSGDPDLRRTAITIPWS